MSWSISPLQASTKYKLFIVMTNDYRPTCAQKLKHFGTPLIHDLQTRKVL